NNTKRSKVSASRRIKNYLKPVLGKMFKSKEPKRNSYVEVTKAMTGWMNMNMANEDIENRIIEEVQSLPDDAAIFIINEDGDQTLQYINKDKFTVPVHFAQTESGTLFWTSPMKTINAFKIEWTFLDRWAQA
uniref:Uncharacterized protein n=1 Tax=Megaselia scalaris TaxID=36166 RepID=T1H7L6_MEGSC